MVRAVFSEIDLAGRGAMFCCGLQRVLAGAEPGNTEPVVSRDLRVLGGVLRAVPAVGGVAIAGGVAGSLSEPSGAYILKNREDVIIIL